MLADDDVDLYLKTSEKKRPEARLGDQQKQWIEDLEAAGDTEKRFNASFFSHGDSREPELAGIGSAIVGSFFTMLRVHLRRRRLAGVAAAVGLLLVADSAVGAAITRAHTEARGITIRPSRTAVRVHRQMLEDPAGR